MPGSSRPRSRSAVAASSARRRMRMTVPGSTVRELIPIGIEAARSASKLEITARLRDPSSGKVVGEDGAPGFALGGEPLGAALGEAAAVADAAAFEAVAGSLAAHAEVRALHDAPAKRAAEREIGVVAGALVSG